MYDFKRNAVALRAAAFFCGCLEFGDDIRLVAPDVTDKELNEVTQRTGIRFPVGATGLA